jgi:hypothetical protein
MHFNPSSWLPALQINGFLSYFAGSSIEAQLPIGPSLPPVKGRHNVSIQRDAFLDTLVANMTVPELGTSSPHSLFRNSSSILHAKKLY